MKATLVEVLGEEQGSAMYTDEWLQNRVREHLDPARYEGQVFLAEADSDIVGHTIVRVETDETGERFGLFSTFYVDPTARGKGVAKNLVRAGETWMIDRNLSAARTYTAESNSKLIGLMESFGYPIELRKNEMVVLARRLIA
ncbi:MAG: hypothetical protein HONBIEJF_01760 [Fimbriimonadaceae bacterium]|nr:hypothetical protein [Fimbriimonadaceae bacterium]